MAIIENSNDSPYFNPEQLGNEATPEIHATDTPANYDTNPKLIGVEMPSPESAISNVVNPLEILGIPEPEKVTIEVLGRTFEISKPFMPADSTMALEFWGDRIIGSIISVLKDDSLTVDEKNALRAELIKHKYDMPEGYSS